MERFYKIANNDGDIFSISSSEIKLFCDEHDIEYKHLQKTSPVANISYRTTSTQNGWRILEVKLKDETDNEVIINQDRNIEAVQDYSYKKEQQNQKYRDKLRIQRKEDRAEYRILNAIEHLEQEIIDRVDKFTPCPDIVLKYNESYDAVCVQMSDLHLGEVVNLPDNKYNLEIAKERLEYIFSEVEFECEIRKTDTIHILFTGDLFNLDTHMDKKLTNAHVQAKNLEIGFGMLSGIFDQLIELGYTLKLAGVVGNESRLKGYENMSHIDSLAIDNFDYILFVMFKARYSNCKQVVFMNSCDKLVDIVNINDKNIAMIHGNTLKHNILEKDIDMLKFKLYNQYGIMVDYVITSHIHSTYITNTFARNASLVGSNGYSAHALNIPNSSAGQNMLLVGDYIKCFSIRVN